MAARTKEDSITPSSGNVFADLALEDADEPLAKAKLVHAISGAMKSMAINQTKIASMLGIDQSKVSKLLRGQTDGFSSDRLLRILNQLGQDVEIIVRPKPANENRAAHVTVATYHLIGEGISESVPQVESEGVK